MRTKDYERIRYTLHNLREYLRNLEEEALPNDEEVLFDEDYRVAHAMKNIIRETEDRIFEEWCRYDEALSRKEKNG